MSRPKTIYLGYLTILATLGAGIVYVAVSAMGPGVSTDAAMMLSTAENVVRGHGLITYTGGQLAQFGPLYSLLLALGSMLFHQDVFVIGWWLTGISFAAIIWVSGWYFYRTLGSVPALPYIASFIIFSSTSLIEISANIASDPIFLLLVVLFLICMTSYLESGKSWLVAAAAMLVVVACFQRYAGLALALTGGALIAWANRRALRDAILYGAGFSALSAVPILLWGTLHNVPANGTAFGGRLPAVPFGNLTTGLEKVLYWFLPLRVVMFRGTLPLAGVLLIAGIVALLAARKQVLPALATPQRLPSLVFLLVYGAVLVFDISYYELKGINTDRVHIIILPALLILVLPLMARLWTAAGKQVGERPMAVAALLLSVVWSIYPLTKTYAYVHESMIHGDVSSYNSINKDEIRTSPLAHYLLSLDMHNKKVYSNGSDSVWFMMRTEVLPIPTVDADDRAAYLQQQYAGWPGTSGQGYVVWLQSEAHKPGYARPAELASIAQMQETYSDDRGSVYLVGPR